MKSTKFLLLAAWLCLSLGAYAQTTYYVGPSGNNSNSGTQTAPFQTIAYAISQASDEDIIQLLTGEYEEGNILVNKPLTITGLGEEVSLAPAVGDNQVFNISVDGITIEGLDLIGNTSAIAFLVSGVDGLNIRQNTISGFASGIVVQNTGVTNLSITNNFINGNTSGIQIETGASPITGVINENSFSGNPRALENNSTSIINASFNWWGGTTITAVTGAISATNGNVNNLIDYNPWLSSDIDINANPIDGYQPSFNTLIVRKQNNSPVLEEAIDKLNNIEGRLIIYNKVASASAYEAIPVNKAVILSAAGSQNPILTGLTLGSDVTLSGNITLNDITLNGYTLKVDALESTSKLSIPLAIAADLPSQDGEIEGPVAILPVQVGANTGIQALGVSISAGPEALGQVTIQRNAGTEAVINETRNFQSITTIWDITVGINEFTPRDVTFQWLEAEDNGVFIDNAVVWKNPGPTDTGWELIAQGPFDANGEEDSDIRSVTVSVESFSQFTISDDEKPLPVELTSFSASLLEPHVELNWETVSEINSDFFSVERSENGKDFKEIGQLKAAGDSDVPLQYRYIDEQASKRFSGSLFYRLRTVDFDGSFEYSDITLVHISDDDIPMITAFAREGQQSLKLFTRGIEAGDYRVWITDLSGRKIFEQDLQLAPKEAYEIGIGSLPQSVYLIRCVGKQLALSTKFRVEEVN